MKRSLWLFAAVALAGCDKGPGNGAAPPGGAPMTDAQAAEASWKQWHERVLARDGKAAWECLSKRTRAERSLLYRADAARIRGLSGAALDAESRAWGSTATAIAGASAEDLAALALAKEFGRPDRAEAERTLQVAAVTVSGEVATIRLSSPGRPAAHVALIKDEGRWKLDDLESQRATGR
jgi:hypothetical protein